jgi:hypothetical protein
MEQPHADRADEPGVVYIPVSWGELIDKLTILELKAGRFRDPEQLDNVRRELAALRTARDRGGPMIEAVDHAAGELAGVNRALWEVEQALRSFEREGRFDAEFQPVGCVASLGRDKALILARVLDHLAVLIGGPSAEPR